jgi:hypothetical protein
MANTSATLEAPARGNRRASSKASTPTRIEPDSPGKTVASRAPGAHAQTPVSLADQLDALGPAGRLEAYRSGPFSRRERTIWACCYPEEVPILNGEVEWIALTMADLD